MYGVTKLDYCDDISLISYNNLPVDVSLLSLIFSAYSDEGINIDIVSQAAPFGDKLNISFTCHDSDIVKALSLSKKLSLDNLQIKPMVSSGNCKIQLYGEEMRDTPGVFAKVMTCLAHLPAVEIKQIATSEIDISLLISSAYLSTCVETLKNTFAL